MPATISGDYSRYPPPIGTVFPLIAGEVAALRDSWELYVHLFMAERSRTELLASHLGALLGTLQQLLEEQLFLSIGRLTDRASRDQENLSLQCLADRIPNESDPQFRASVRSAIDQIQKAAASLRKHRHKRIAHFDLHTSLGQAALPAITYSEIRSVLELMEQCLDLFYWEFERTTMLFDTRSPGDITEQAELTAHKARAYDLLEAEGLIPKSEWRKRAAH